MVLKQAGVNGGSASDRLLELIGGKIISGEFPPGAKLIEEDLSKELGVSRAPLREALLRLEERQLVERVPYSGTRVSSLSLPVLTELYEIRGVLEGLSCRRAAAIITPYQVRDLQAYLDMGAERVAAIRETGSKQMPPDKGFHVRIAEISGNNALLRMLSQEIWLFSRVTYKRFVHSPERVSKAVEEHRRILEALADHDADFAEFLMRRHIASALQGINEALRS